VELHSSRARSAVNKKSLNLKGIFLPTEVSCPVTDPDPWMTEPSDRRLKQQGPAWTQSHESILVIKTERKQG